MVTVLGVGCLLLVSLGSAAWFFSNKGEVHISNEATERVVKGEVEICDQQYKFEGIKPRESKVIHYKVKSDSHYKITVEFESGKKMVKEVGYVTNGMDFKDALIIKDSDITLMR